MRLTLLPLMLMLAQDLPRGWTLEKEIDVPRDRLDAVAQKLGAAVDRLVNRHLSINGTPARYNVVTCPTDDAAATVHEALVKSRGDAFCARNGRDVVEFVGNSKPVADRLRLALGLAKPAEASYDVSFRIACIDALDGMTANEASNVLAALDRKPDDEKLLARLRELTKGWTTGKTIRLRKDAAWEFTPKPSKTEEAGDAVVCTFENPPVFAGLPYVEVRATIKTADRLAATAGKAGSTDATPYWPSTASAFKELAGRLSKDRATDHDKLLAIQRWVVETVKYGGPVGSRWGAEKALTQKQGRCWDKADVLVTLCRAAGLPAREVAGWVTDANEGHVWTEVWLKDEGWLPVDATAPWTGISRHYVPFFVTDDGAMPIVYVRLPVVKVK